MERNIIRIDEFGNVTLPNDITNVCKLSGLPQDVYKDIMWNYKEYLKLYK